MEFTKYKKLGDYHWRLYDKKRSAKKGIDFRVAWVQEKKVLDIGAGDGLITHLLNCKGIDNEESGVKIAQEKGADVILGEANDLPFPDNSFESALMSDSIEHFEDPIKAVKEAHRVIKKFLYVITPERKEGV